VSVLAFLETSVLLYCFDEREPEKRDRAQAWVRACWQRYCGRTSTQVLNEFYANARKKFATALSAGDARSEIRRYQHWKPWAIDHATMETAWAIESRQGFSYWDSLIIAAAQQQGCTLLVSESMPHGQQVDSVRIINPFLLGPEVLDEPIE